MNVSKKVLVIIYVIFALLTSVVIFASQSIFYSSFSSLEANESIENVKNAKNVIDFQVMQLDETNSALSSREDIRAFMLSQDPEDLGGNVLKDFFSLNGDEFIFFVNSSGNIIYSPFLYSNNTSNTSILSEINRKIDDKSLLCKDAQNYFTEILIIENNFTIVSYRPVFAAPNSREVIGTIILGKNLDSYFIDSLQDTGNHVSLYSQERVPADLRQAFLENADESSPHTIERNGVLSAYFIFKDINQKPAVMILTDADSIIHAEGQKSLRYFVIFLLFAGLMIGAGCKLLLDKEVISRIVAIDNFVQKVGKNEDFSERCSIDGDDELSRLSVGINQMLDRLKVASDKIKIQEHEKKVILNSLTEMLVFMDSELKIIWVNKASLDHVGLKFEDIIGRRYEEIYTLYEKSSGKSPVLKAVESGNEELGEVVTHDGKIWMIRASPVKDENGRITGILQTGLDITAHKHSEEKLIQAKLEAEAANRTKSEFLTNMSHELRTPLNSIIGFSDILLERAFGELNEKQLKYIGNISTSGKHLLELINDILDLSKVEAGKMELHYSEFSVDPIFEEVRAAFIPLAQAKSLEIIFNLDCGFTTLEADRSRLIQILYNLISNAIKFTPEGGKISVSCIKNGSLALIAVKDTGIGISSEDQRKLFQPFTQIDASSSRQYCGTGLGLALVKKIVNLHQGDIWVESAVGTGSTFSLSIPLRKQVESGKYSEVGLEDVILEFEMNKAETIPVKRSINDFQENIELPKSYPPEKKEEERKGLVLIVENDKNSNELLSIVLREAGYSVASLFNGNSVLEVAKKLNPEIITLDIFLPDTNGWFVLRQLKNDPQTASIPVLIISMTNNNELGIALGATYSFTKTVKKSEMVGSLKELINKFRLESPRVLIVDEDENNMKLLSSMIEPEGFEVIKAYSGKEGLQKLFSEKQPDILIINLMMSKGSGFDVISSMKANISTKNIPFIVCTSGEFTEKNIEDLNSQMKGNLISILKKGTFGRKELINRIKQLAMLKRHDDERNFDC
ncbi:MAG: response regulator [Methanosarcina sp.]